MIKKMLPELCSALVVLGVFAGCSQQPREDQISVASSGEFEKGDDLTGSQVLRRSEKAYAALQSYVGTIDLARSTNYGDSSFDRMRHFKITFERPDKFRLEEKSGSGGPLLIVSNSEGTWEVAPGPGGQTVRTRSESLKESLDTFQGVTLQASDTLGGMLLGIEWSKESMFHPEGRLLSAFATKAKLHGMTTVDGHKCFEIVCARNIATWILAVDEETHLVRRIVEHVSEEQQEEQKRLGGGGFTGRITGGKTVQTFKIESVNSAIDPAIFSTPPRP
jgi:hypothetical protein